jgi:hypothetical protein
VSTISGEELNSQSDQSSMIIATSSTQPSSTHDDLISDLKKEISKVASTIKDPIQQEMYQCLERWISNKKIKQIGLTIEEEGKLDSDIEIEDVASNTENVLQGSNLHSNLSLDQKRTRSCSRERCKFASSKTKTLFGTIYFNSKVYEGRGVSRYENLYMFHPANWLVSLGMKSSFDAMISKSTQGWKNNLSSRTFRAVPKDALIIQYCANGDIEGIKTLLARGDASIMDRCPFGFTLLHVSKILFSSSFVTSKHRLSYLSTIQI